MLIHLNKMMETDQTAESFVCSSSSEAFVLKLNTFIKMDVVEGIINNIFCKDSVLSN